MPEMNHFGHEINIGEQMEEKMKRDGCKFYVRYASVASKWRTASKWTEPMTEGQAIEKAKEICSSHNEVAHAIADNGTEIRTYAICHLGFGGRNKDFTDYRSWVFGDAEDKYESIPTRKLGKQCKN